MPFYGKMHKFVVVGHIRESLAGCKKFTTLIIILQFS